MMTPHLRFSAKAIAESAQQMSSRVNQANKTWSPQLGSNVPLEILHIVRNKTSSASCRSITDVESLVAADFQTIIVTRPVVDPESLARLAMNANRAKILVVIDHFRQAELLSNAMLARSATAGALIEVDLGRQTCGVRPGPDSVLLAAAIAKLPAVELRGLYVDDRNVWHINGQTDSKISIHEAVGIALHCQRMITAESVECREVVTGFGHLAEAVDHPAVTTLLTGPCHSVATVASDANSTPAVGLVCRVLSRPSLEWCIIDAGTSSMIDLTRSKILKPAGARLLHVQVDTATLILQGDSLDLRIGDEVVLSADHSEQSQRLVGHVS